MEARLDAQKPATQNAVEQIPTYGQEIYEDGNDHEHARQEIPYTDFPMNSITLYACWDGEHWVIMLPSEY